MYSALTIARMGHAIVRELQIANKEAVILPHWEDADQWMRDSSLKTAEAMLAGMTPEQIHDRYVTERELEGWSYGPVKDLKEKTNPTLVPYYDVPYRQVIKDKITMAIVGILR